MQQLSLNMTPRLPYSAETFLVHQGVKEILDFCNSQMPADEYRICVIYGEAKSGKTHLSLKLVSDLKARGCVVRLLDGAGVEKFLSAQVIGAEYDPKTVIIIDDAEDYFSKVTPERSGEFVNFIEALRRSNAGIIILTGQEPDTFPIDDHVRSRLRPGEGFFIGTPAEEELQELVSLMARQRGINLSPRKVSYLVKRVERSVPAVASTMNILLTKCEEEGDVDSYDVLASLVK